MNSEWPNVVNLEKLELEPSKDWSEPYKYATHRPATPMGAKKLGFNISTIPPKQFSCPYHFHHFEEELFVILEGKAVLRQAGKFREVVQGDLIFFQTGPEGVHQFYNPTEQDCKFLAISSQAEVEVAEYPDSKKIFVGKLRKLFKAESEVPYLTDEENPAQYWPKDRL